MKNKRLMEYISKNFTVTNDELDQLDSIFFEETIRKGTLIVSHGDYSKSISFINQGLVRYYYISRKSSEHTKWFCFENDFIVNLSSIIENRESDFYIETLEESNVCSAPIEKFLGLKEASYNLSRVYLSLLEKSYIAKEAREAELLLYDATTRYKKFLREGASRETRIPQHHIASYLGIKPETLSRIRKKIIDTSQ